MDKYFTIILNSNIFRGITLQELPTLLHRSEPKIKHFSEGNRIWQAGENSDSFGLVCEGRIQIVKEDRRGNRMIIATIEPTDIFGEAYAYAAAGPLPVSVDVVQDATVLFFKPERLLTLNNLPGGMQLIRNSLQILAQKSLMLNQKIEVLSQRKITDKVLAYLRLEQKRQRSTHLVLPYNRQEMADFLGVERSALSATLGEMKKEGLMDYHKNEFVLFNSSEI